MAVAIDFESHDDLLRQLAQCEADGATMAAEIARLKAAVWAAIPWLDDLEHLGSIVDQDRRAQTAALLKLAVTSQQT